MGTLSSVVEAFHILTFFIGIVVSAVFEKAERLLSPLPT